MLSPFIGIQWLKKQVPTSGLFMILGSAIFFSLVVYGSAEREKIFINMLPSCLEKHPTKWPLYLEEVTMTSNRTLMERSTEVVTFEVGQSRVEGFHLCRCLCVKEGECRANLSSREGEAAADEAGQTTSL